MSFDIPETMTAIEITEFGGPEVLKPASRPVPQPAAGEVLVRNAAVGVNFPDTMQRQGVYPPPPGTTDIPGLELAGTVVAAGDGVSRHAPGDEVCALVSGGAYAEYTVVPEQLALPLPGGYDMIRAAAIPENFFTVWTNLFDGVQLTAGDSILIHGGSGGIGTAAIQVSRAFGATVFTTARNAEKCRVCEELGATRAINYTEEDFVEVVKNATGAAGCSVVLDMVGGDYFARNLDVLAMDGRMVQVAVQKGAKVELFIPTIMSKRLHYTGSTLRPRTTEQKAVIAEAVERNLWPLFEKGDIKPLIYTTFPLAEAADAHALMASSDHIGKIMLSVDGAA
ncbi:MAG: NAD(P)H-quinone oxidoreductase [Alphaproteobacteria bacterium]|nr:NAD(P)H-quinone oxidoreductase [Alphaproteobacteria bacterium]